MQLIPLQEPSEAHRNEHHRVCVSAGWRERVQRERRGREGVEECVWVIRRVITVGVCARAPVYERERERERARAHAKFSSASFSLNLLRILRIFTVQVPEVHS